MAGKFKPDAEQFQAVMEGIAEQGWLRGEREWWPKYVLHYTDVQNAASILRRGYLYSRAHLPPDLKIHVDSGSQEVLSRTDDWVKDYVRLYFRPKTPTQFHTEGIRTKDRISHLDVHCPVPVFFLFDSAKVLAMEGTEFSDGNLASPWAARFTKSSDLQALPWKQIYHLGRIQGDTQTVKFHRCAEVIVPERLGLDYLDSIHCRTDAEKETLLNLLGPKLRERFSPIVVASMRRILHERKYTFVETVRLGADGLNVHFQPDSECPGPFDLMVEVTSPNLAQPLIKQKSAFYTSDDLGMRFSKNLEEYEVRIHLDKHLAYVGEFAGQDLLV